MAEQSPETTTTSLPSIAVSTPAPTAPAASSTNSPPSTQPPTLPPTSAPTVALPTPSPAPTPSSNPTTAPAPPTAATPVLSTANSDDVTGTGMMGNNAGAGGTTRGPTTNLTSKAPSAPSITIRKPQRPGVPNPSYPSAPPANNLSHAGPSTPSNGPPAAPASVFPAVHLTPLNDTFVPKQISLHPAGTKVKIGRQTNAKTVPNASNGYFDSKVLSRMHAEIWSEDGKVLIKDVKSSNGTFINGTRLSQEAAESDVFELHSEDVVEFGIDIVSDDNKTIVHHKVAAKVYLVMNPEDAAVSQREFQHWYRAASEAPLQRRGAKPVATGSNGLSFEHVLSRLQGEIQKSRDTGSHLGDLNSTLNEVHDTLGGGAPPPLPNFPHPSRVPPFNPNNKDAHAQSIAALQTQLNETQNSLAGHVGKIRDLEGLLAEHEVIKHEVGSLRKQMEDAQRDMDSMMRGRDSVRNGRESPVAALLDAQEAADDDDTRSISSTDTVRLNTADQLASVNHSSRQNGVIPMVNGIVEGTSKADDLAREKQLQEQNAKLSARLEALSAELEEATKLGQSLRTQHAEASSTIRALEDRVQGLEKAVEGRVAEVEGKVLKEAEEKWKGWKDAFEDSWKKERESWESERAKLTAVVREWEERKKSSSSSDEDEASETEEVAGAAAGEKGINASTSSTKSTKGKRPRSRRRRRSTASRVTELVSSTDGGVASDSDETIGDTSPAGPQSGAWGNQRGGAPMSGNPAGFGSGWQGAGGTQAMPYASAGVVVLVGVAAAWALSVKLKE